jgi:hypothetical protein
LGFL